MTTGEICNRQVVITGPDASILAAAGLMKAHHVGDVVVVDDQSGRRVPIGILTDRDIVVAGIADHFPQFAELRVEDLMTRNPIVSPESENLYDAVKKMQSHGIRRLPVVNAAGGLEGILTFDDVVELLSEELVDLAKLVAREQKHERLQRL